MVTNKVNNQISRRKFLGKAGSGLTGLVAGASILPITGCSFLNPQAPKIKKVPKSLHPYPAVIFTTPPKNSPVSAVSDTQLDEKVYLKLLEHKAIGKKLQGDVKVGTWEDKNPIFYASYLDYPQEFTESPSREIELNNGLISIYVNIENYNKGWEGYNLFKKAFTIARVLPNLLLNPYGVDVNSDSLTTILIDENGNKSRSDSPELAIEPHPNVFGRWACFTFGYSVYVDENGKPIDEGKLFSEWDKNHPHKEYFSDYLERIAHKKQHLGKQIFELYRRHKDEPASEINPRLRDEPDFRAVFELTTRE